MTTMSIQLRRVVYLLVLLQCCACLAQEGANGVWGEALDEHQDVLVAEKKAKAWMKKVSEYLAEGRSYSSVLEGVVNLSNESSKLANSTALDFKKLVEEVEKKAMEKVEPKYKLEDDEKRTLEGLVQKVNKSVDDTGSLVNDTKWANYACSLSRDTLVNVLNGFDGSRVYYLSKLAEPNKTYWTLDNVKLARISNKTYHDVYALKEKYGVLADLSTRSVIEAMERMEGVQKTMDEIKKKLENIKEKVVEGELDGIVKLVDEVVNSCTPFVGVDKAWVEKRKLPAKTNVDAKMKAKKKEIEKQIPGEIEAEEKRMVQEEQAKRDEAARLEKERLAKLEEDKRLAKEKERLAQEELERKKKAEEDAEKRRTAEEAGKRKADEKRAQEEKAKQDQERRDAEEKARVALEKKEKEQLERAAEEARKKAEATKKNDNSHSPSLVHSPFLLLLLCVLGSTLV
ncbi:uncharacterized protein TM35_000201010, partial [Trypanosoma theileri]